MMMILLVAALVHPVHETLAEVEWNPETKRLEVAVRLDALDEQWLRGRVGRRGDVSKWAVGYLRQRFRVADRPAKNEPDSTTYHWVGRAEEGAHRWWYFEIETEDRKRPRWVEQRMLLDREERYLHTVLFLHDKRPRSVTLTAKRTRAYLDRPTNEPNPVESDATTHTDR